MRTKSAVSTSIDTLSDAIDSIPFSSITDVDVPDLSAVTDALGETTTMVADTALVIGRRGGRVATRTARSAWKNRETVATVAVVAIVLLAIASLVKRSVADDSDDS